MANRRRPGLARVVVALVVVGAACLGRPIRAEAQARGTLQVTAQVVDTKASFDGLQAARVALRQVEAGIQITSIDTVSTLAQVSIAQPPQGRSELVVTIDYSKN
jgi:hypothetical protein